MCFKLTLFLTKFCLCAFVVAFLKRGIIILPVEKRGMLNFSQCHHFKAMSLILPARKLQTQSENIEIQLNFYGA